MRKTRILTCLLAVMLCMAAFSMPALAYADDVDHGITPEAPEIEETTGGAPLTPEGNLTLIDDILQPETFYTVHLDFGDFSAESRRFGDKGEAKVLADACRSDVAVVETVERREKSERAPALYDLTTLQRDANKALGYTAQQTLDYAQSLYEKKLCTYPRTDSRYLTNDMEGSVKAIVLCAAGLCDMPAPASMLASQVCSSKKVSDHHAILPTIAAGEITLANLPAGEREILKLIAGQVLRAVAGQQVSDRQKDHSHGENGVRAAFGWPRPRQKHLFGKDWYFL